MPNETKITYQGTLQHLVDLGYIPNITVNYLFKIYWNELDEHVDSKRYYACFVDSKTLEVTFDEFVFDDGWKEILKLI